MFSPERGPLVELGSRHGGLVMKLDCVRPEQR
jgi:hypothetical protein